ncbi:AAA family ATPase [Rhodoferax sp. U11-2br]|uniref:AAA family ATPase n=1 Tax=Rhodoferax sp. U11-2br TaxID=2838878 RepID=UPI001BE7BB58|nr:AAA family ATPase [Rhodoferax sp. U11-2br]MBT3068788.1 AAA family ATPase [Rhodoferax sp. U11-2br]
MHQVFELLGKDFRANESIIFQGCEVILKKRIQELLRHLSVGMYEREEIVAVSFLGALSGQNTFLYGPPGTAKSLISRRIACGFEEPSYFECLMNRFSTPEEVFGPVSIKELREDRYVRKTEGYLPRAEFAFLDEIWKSSPAILNALLTLINERRFRNGDQIEDAPLKALIAASNETPDDNQGLDALYDRFIVRLMVPPIAQSDHFNNLLNSPPTEARVKVPVELVVKQAEWDSWRRDIQSSVRLSDETLSIIHMIRDALQDQHETLNVYVSDRRWQRAAMLMKAAAFFNDRKETNHSDALLLQHCLWTTNENREAVAKIVATAVQQSGFEGDADLAALDRTKDACDKEIHQELYHSEDLYDTVEHAGKPYFQAEVPAFNSLRSGQIRSILIPCEKLKSSEAFNPLAPQGAVLQDVSCKFDGQGVCEITLDQGYASRRVVKATPSVLFHKGDKITGVNKRLVKALTQQVLELKNELETVRDQAQARVEAYRLSMASTFVPEVKTELAYQGVLGHVERLNLRVLDCERLLSLCQ